MIKFAHIAPTSMIPQAMTASGINLALAHLIVGANEYSTHFRNSKLETIMDNGAFELGESMNPEELIERAKLVNATYIVLPDYPGQPWQKTVEAAKVYIPLFKKAGFKTFFAPQSEKGDFNGLLKAWEWALYNEDIDLIGNSILAAPNAVGQSYALIARYKVLRQLAIEQPKGLLEKRIHMLGMLDTVHEISLVKPFHWMINSWDTSAAVWYGMNGKLVEVEFDKFRLAVDFEAPAANENTVMCNINYINQLI